jgi:hypothetical protein
MLPPTLTPMGLPMPRMNSTCALFSCRVRSPHHRKWPLQPYHRPVVLSSLHPQKGHAPPRQSAGHAGMNTRQCNSESAGLTCSRQLCHTYLLPLVFANCLGPSPPESSSGVKEMHPQASKNSPPIRPKHNHPPSSASQLPTMFLRLPAASSAVRADMPHETRTHTHTCLPSGCLLRTW